MIEAKIERKIECLCGEQKAEAEPVGGAQLGVGHICSDPVRGEFIVWLPENPVTASGGYGAVKPFPAPTQPI